MLGAANPSNCLTKHLNAAMKAASFEDLGLIDMTQAPLQQLMLAAEEIELVGAVSSTRQATPWKPNRPLTSAALKIVIFQQMISSCTGDYNSSNNSSNTDIATAPVCPVSLSHVLVVDEYTVWWLIVIAVILAFAAYGLKRLCSDIVTGWQEMRRDKSEDLKLRVVYTTQTPVVHLRTTCDAYARADPSKTSERPVCMHCQRALAKELRTYTAATGESNG